MKRNKAFIIAGFLLVLGVAGIADGLIAHERKETLYYKNGVISFEQKLVGGLLFCLAALSIAGAEVRKRRE